MKTTNGTWTPWTNEKCSGHSSNSRYYYMCYPGERFMITFDANTGSIYLQGTKSDGTNIQKTIVTQ